MCNRVVGVALGHGDCRHFDWVRGRRVCTSRYSDSAGGHRGDDSVCDVGCWHLAAGRQANSAATLSIVFLVVASRVDLVGFQFVLLSRSGGMYDSAAGGRRGIELTVCRDGSCFILCFSLSLSLSSSV